MVTCKNDLKLNSREKYSESDAQFLGDMLM